MSHIRIMGPPECILPHVFRFLCSPQSWGYAWVLRQVCREWRRCCNDLLASFFNALPSTSLLCDCAYCQLAPVPLSHMDTWPRFTFDHIYIPHYMMTRLVQEAAREGYHRFAGYVMRHLTRDNMGMTILADLLEDQHASVEMVSEACAGGAKPLTHLFCESMELLEELLRVGMPFDDATFVSRTPPREMLCANVVETLERLARMRGPVPLPACVTVAQATELLSKEVCYCTVESLVSSFRGNVALFEHLRSTASQELLDIALRTIENVWPAVEQIPALIALGFPIREKWMRMAIEKKNWEVIQVLLARGCVITEDDMLGVFGNERQAASETRELFTRLREAGGPVGFLVYLDMIMGGMHDEVLEMLKAEPGNIGLDVMRCAGMYGDVQMLETLHAHGGRVSDDWLKGICCSPRVTVENVAWGLSKGIKPTTQTLRQALLHDNRDAVALLIAAGAPTGYITLRVSTYHVQHTIHQDAFATYCRQGNLDAVKWLVWHKCVVTYDGVIGAALTGHIHVLQWLLQRCGSFRVSAMGPATEWPIATPDVGIVLPEVKYLAEGELSDVCVAREHVDATYSSFFMELACRMTWPDVQPACSVHALMFVIDHGGPMTQQLMSFAAGFPKDLAMRELHQRGCPYNSKVFISAVFSGGRTSNIEFLAQNGYQLTQDASDYLHAHAPAKQLSFLPKVTS